MTGPPARMISHMARHDTVRPPLLPAALIQRARLATSADGHAVRSKRRADRAPPEIARGWRPPRRSRESVVPAARQRATTPASGMPQRLPNPADAMPSRADTALTSSGRRRTAAAVMRQQDDIGRSVVDNERRLRCRFRVGEQQSCAAGTGHRKCAGAVVVASSQIRLRGCSTRNVMPIPVPARRRVGNARRTATGCPAPSSCARRAVRAAGVRRLRHDPDRRGSR